MSLLESLNLILLTLFVVLLERKFLAWAQRRMGPAMKGRNGYFQIITDLVKLISKETFLIVRASIGIAPLFLALLYATQVNFSQLFIWGPSFLLFIGMDSLILFYLIFTLMSNTLFTILGLLSQSRYAMLGSIRSLVHVLSLDIFVTLIYSWLVLGAQSANFHDFVTLQKEIWLSILYGPISFAFLILLILESKRAPFDHAETESEVVAGYAVEYGAAMLLIFYLAEYIHLVISSISIIVFFLGGWNTPSVLFINPILALPNQLFYS